MKKIIRSIAVLLLLSGTLFAQGGAERSTTTVIADVLAQLPASDEALYEKLMGDLAQSGSSSIASLIDKLQPTGGDNTPLSFALSGLTFYATQPGQESFRKELETVYQAGILRASDREIKAFLIRQLQIMGSNASLPVLTPLLSEPNLCGPAARALAAIGTPEAVEAMLSVLPKIETETQADAINALAMSRDARVEPFLLEMLAGAEANQKKTLLFALATCGTESALPALGKEVEMAHYRYEKSNALQAYVQLLKRLEQSNPALVAEAALRLQAAAEANESYEGKFAALSLLTAPAQAARINTVKRALKSPDKAYRAAALTALTPEEAPLAASWLKRAKTDVKTDLLNWLAETRDAGTLQQVAALLKSKDAAVYHAAVRALQRIGTPDALQLLTDQFQGADSARVQTVYQSLLAFDGAVAEAAAASYAKASSPGKVAVLQLLAARRGSAQSEIVYQGAASSDTRVREAAFAAFPAVALSKDLEPLCRLLESASDSECTSLQAAIAVAISGKSAADKLVEVEKRIASSEKPYRYIPILSSIGTPEALQKAVAAFAAAEQPMRDAAFQTLLQWNKMDVADPLFAICADASASGYFDRALEAYIKVVSASGMPGENRLIFLRNAFEIAKTNDQKNWILYEIQQTGTLQALLFAGAYINDAALQQVACRAVLNIALNNPQHNGRNVRALLQQVAPLLKGGDADYERQAITDMLAQRPDEEGFVSLFNGKDLSGWKGLVKNPIERAKMNSDQLAEAQKAADAVAADTWSVDEAGNLVFDGKGDNLCTNERYGDFEMYVDWMLDPNGAEPDAGIYLRGTPQVQIWDTSRVNVGAQVGSGGLYNNQLNVSKPRCVADNRLGQWNTFYIKMVGERVTVYLNGVLVVDNVIMENYWDRTRPIFPEEQIELQAHGSKVYYRDILVKRLPRVEPQQLSQEEQKAGFRFLFDGTDMHQWRGNTTDYISENGVIALYPKNGGGGNLYTKEEFGDFELRFEFQLTAAANNGLGIRTPLEGDAAYVGMELQILDNEHPVYADLAPYQYHGSVYGIIPAKRGFHKPVGQWNTQEVIAKGDHIMVKLNGEVILDGNIRKAVKNGTPDGKEHPGLFNKKGHIGFLGHGSEVKFRNIRIKTL